MMTSRRVRRASLALGLLTLGCAVPSFAGEKKAAEWDRTKAAVYLDRRGEDWFNFGASHRGKGESASSCISCHSLLSFALARPVLRQLTNVKVPTKHETKLLEQTRRRVANWDKLDAPEFQLYYDFDDDKKKQSRGTESVLNALVLALDERLQVREQPSESTKKAIEILWENQIKDGKYAGSWDWLNFGMEPWENEDSRFMGAAMAAIAVGSAPGHVRVSDFGAKRPQAGALRAYLKKHYPLQNLHNQIWMLWASACLDGLLAPEEQRFLIVQILAKQQSSGGWDTGSLGHFARKDVTKNTQPDGYATGLILHVLQVAGQSKDEPQIAKGLAWLKANQDPTGAWRASSINKNRAPESKDHAKANVGKFMWDAATAYSVLALSH
jgi:hypothetical protein